MLTLVEVTHEDGSGMLILSLISVIHFVSHLKSMSSYTHHCVYGCPIYHKNRSWGSIMIPPYSTWSYKIDQLAAHSHQRLGVILCTKDHLGQSGQITAYKSFVCPICEYGNVVFTELLPHIKWIESRRWLRGCVVPPFCMCQEESA